MGAFFYGYIVTQIPGGWLAGVVGGKHVLGTGLLIGGITTVLVPFLAKAGVGPIVAQRVILGMAMVSFVLCCFWSA